MTWLVVGLGNPGPAYVHNRHNIGFMVIDELARRSHGVFASKFNGRFAKTQLAGEGIYLLQPLTFMNRSGPSVGSAASFFKLEASNVLVVHDELDLPFGRLRLKSGGGHGGHNGLRSIFEHFPRDFYRLRVGIGRPKRGDVSHHVLSDFDAVEERPALEKILDNAADAVECVIAFGAKKAMNDFNGDADG